MSPPRRHPPALSPRPARRAARRPRRDLSPGAAPADDPPLAGLRRLLAGEPSRLGADTVIVAAHPDDETIGLGARLPALSRALLVHVTDGAPENGVDAARHGFPTPLAYAAERRRELLDALAAAGFDPARTRSLACPDQRATLHLASLALRVFAILRDAHPAFVITHPYEGGHPDHDATAFAVHAAVRLLARAGDPAPAIAEMCSYHASSLGIETGCFLPREGAHELLFPLSPEEQAFKHALLDRFRTQADTLRFFPLDAERFRLAPAYDFTRPPHDGPLFYERFDWGMRGDRFTRLARQALADLGLPEDECL